MKKWILFTLSLLLAFSFAYAQNLSAISSISVFKQSAQQRNCGTMQHLEYLKGKDKQLEGRMLKNEINIKNWIKTQSGNKSISS